VTEMSKKDEQTKLPDFKKVYTVKQHLSV